MADKPDKASKTEEPTQKRIEDAHARGQFAKSQEIQLGFILATTLLVWMLIAENVVRQVSLLTSSVFLNLHRVEVINPELVVDGAKTGMAFIAPLVLPLALGCSAAAVFAGGLQSGWKFTPKAIEPKFDKISPLKGFQQKFGSAAMARFGIEFLKLIGIAGVIAIGVRKVSQDALFSSPISLDRLGSFIMETMILLLGILIVVMGLIAMVSYMYQAKKTHEDLKMTRQEVKDERKNQEGDPLVKQAQRQRAQQNAQRKMFRAVQDADFVVTNPTHYAVALRYRRNVDPAPMVLAKGQDHIALKIREIAKEHGVPVVENPPVARMLHRYGKVDRTIPVELYQMTATVLAYVYRNYRYHFHQRNQRVSLTR